MLGIVIDENQPDYGRGDFLVRPIIGADTEAGTIAIGERVRVGQTVRLHVRDGEVRRRGPARGAGAPSTEALGSQPGGRCAAVHLQRPRLAHVQRPRPRRDGGRRRPRCAGRRVLLRRRDRPGRRAQLPARVHRDDGGLPAEWREREACATSWRARWPRTSARGDITPTRVVPAYATRAGAASSRSRRAWSSASTRPRRRSARPGRGASSASAPEGEWREEVRRTSRSSSGPARALLAAERTALNLLGHLSGIATLTARYVARGRRDRRDDPRHAQDDPGHARAREGGGRRGRRSQPPHGPARRDPDQGEPHRARGRRGGGGRARPRRAAASSRSRSSAATPPRSTRRSRPGAAAAARQHGARRGCAPRSPRATRRRRGRHASRRSRPRAGSRSTTSPRSPPPGSTSSRSAR